MDSHQETRFAPDRLDVSERYSRSLNAIPGFRDRTRRSRALAWIRQNPTRRGTFRALGIAAGTASIAFLGAALLRELRSRKSNSFQARFKRLRKRVRRIA